jgi:hypothetical protein
MDWGKLAQAGSQMMAQAEDEPEQFEWLQPRVLPAMRRFELGKGLLG